MTEASWRSAFASAETAVEACGDDSLQRFGKRHVLRRAAFEVELCELLRVERIALSSFQQRLLDLGRKQPAVEDVRDQRGRLLPGKRGEPKRRGVHLPATPARTALEQLRPRAANDEQRDSAQPVDELVDEVEQALVGPVEVLENEHERPLLRQRLQKPPPCCERLTAAVAAEHGLALQTDERAQVRLHPAGIARVVDGVRDRPAPSPPPLPRCRDRGSRPAP